MRTQKRRVPGAEERIITDLKWLGLDWSEGPDCGGPYGPYRQVRSRHIHAVYFLELEC